MKKGLFIITLAFIAACGSNSSNAEKEGSKDSARVEIDIPDSDEMDQNNGVVQFKTAKKVYLTGKEKMQATAVFDKTNDGLSIGFQLAGDQGKSFIATVTHIPENFTLPLKAKFALSNAFDGKSPVGTVLFLDVSEQGMMTSPMPFEGEMVITKLSKDFMEFEIDGKGGDATDAESPSNWIEIRGQGTLSHPIILSSGIDKNKVLK